MTIRCMKDKSISSKAVYVESTYSTFILNFLDLLQCGIKSVFIVCSVKLGFSTTTFVE